MCVCVYDNFFASLVEFVFGRTRRSSQNGFLNKIHNNINTLHT